MTNIQTVCRSALYMPASNERALSKGPGLEADALILDLEDSVSPELKAQARAQAVKALSEFNYGGRVKALRINDADTPWFADDVAAVAQSRPDAVVLPKVESVNQIAQLSLALSAHDNTQGIAIWAMMESPMAIINAARIAACKEQYPGLSTFLIGNNDLARASNMAVKSDRSLLMPWLMTLVAAAKAYSLNILDGVYNDFADQTGFQLECQQGVEMGMDGKSLIHPSQIAICNEAFSPTADAVQHALAIVEAFSQSENRNAGVLQINGRMVERLHLGMAEALLARAGSLKSGGSDS